MFKVWIMWKVNGVKVIYDQLFCTLLLLIFVLSINLIHIQFSDSSNYRTILVMLRNIIMALTSCTSCMPSMD